MKLNWMQLKHYKIKKSREKLMEKELISNPISINYCARSNIDHEWISERMRWELNQEWWLDVCSEEGNCQF